MKRIYVKATVAGAMAITLSGCGTLSSDFTCKGFDDDGRCMSATETYEKTHDTDYVAPNVDKKGNPIVGAAASIAGAPAAAVAALNGKSGSAGKGGNTEDVVVRKEDAVSARQQTPIPIRRPAEVMRVWIAPWIDRRDRLHTGGFLFAEVETRKWALGEYQDATPQRFFPLTPSEGSAPSKATKAKPAPTAAPTATKPASRALVKP